jgi:hypothetical protein
MRQPAANTASGSNVCNWQLHYKILWNEEKRDFVNYSPSGSTFLCIHIFCVYTYFFRVSQKSSSQHLFPSWRQCHLLLIQSVFFVVCTVFTLKCSIHMVSVCGCWLLPYHMSYSRTMEMTELCNFHAEIQRLFVNKIFICDGCKFQLLRSVNKAWYGTSFIHSQYHILHDYSLLLASSYILRLL